MAVAVQVLDQRNRGFGAQSLDQALATTRDNDVHVVVHGYEQANSIAVRGGNHLHGFFGQTSTFQAAGDDLRQGLVGMKGFATTAQNRGVARFQAQGSGVNSHIGARLVNDADDTQRDTHLSHAHAIRAGTRGADLANRIIHIGNLTQAGGHDVQGAVGQDQAFDHGRGNLTFTCRLQVQLVGCLQLGFLLNQGISHIAQGVGLGFACGGAHTTGSKLGALAQILHHGRQIADLGGGRGLGDIVHSRVTLRFKRALSQQLRS